MAIALCFIAGLMAASAVLAAFIGGYYLAKHDRSEGITMDKGNAEAIKGMSEWMNYKG